MFLIQLVSTLFAFERKRKIRLSGNDERDCIRKVRFGEVLEGLRLGGAYAFDEESYKRFLHLANRNKVKDVWTKEPSSEPAPAMHFIRIQML